TEIQAQVVAEHDPESFGGRLVEAVQTLDLGDQIRVQTLCAPITVAAGGHFRAAAGNSTRSTFKAFKLGDCLFDRTAGGCLDDDEVDQQDAEQSGDDQQQPPENIREHA